jgi:c-di-GMP-binding flagellar brake protein YcgR
MLFFRRLKEKLDIFDLVHVNDRIQLEIENKTYVSRIEDIRGRQIFAAVPVDQGSYKHIAPGRSVIVNVFTPVGLRRFSAVAQGTEIDRVPVVVLTDFNDLGAIQRRHYVRIPQKLPVRYRKDTGVDSLSPWFDAVTADISGGGLRLITNSPEQIKVGDFLEIELFLPDEKPIHAVANVVRVSGGPSLTSTAVGVQFVEIHPADRDRIVGFVFRKETEMGDVRRVSIRSRERVQVSYRKANSQSAWCEGHTFDMSTDGIRIATVDKSVWQAGDLLEIELDIPGIGTVKAVGQVIWNESDSKVSKGSDGSHIEVRFTKISNKSKKAIRAFLMRKKDTNATEQAA